MIQQGGDAWIDPRRSTVIRRQGGDRQILQSE